VRLRDGENELIESIAIDSLTTQTDTQISLKTHSRQLSDSTAFNSLDSLRLSGRRQSTPTREQHGLHEHHTAALNSPREGCHRRSEDRTIGIPLPPRCRTAHDDAALPTRHSSFLTSSTPPPPVHTAHIHRQARCELTVQSPVGQVPLERVSSGQGADSGCRDSDRASGRGGQRAQGEDPDGRGAEVDGLGQARAQDNSDSDGTRELVSIRSELRPELITPSSAVCILRRIPVDTLHDWAHHRPVLQLRVGDAASLHPRGRCYPRSLLCHWSSCQHGQDHPHEDQWTEDRSEPARGGLHERHASGESNS
jgi:hypothetical protein